MTEPRSSQNTRTPYWVDDWGQVRGGRLVVYCPQCDTELQRIENTPNAADHHLPADAPCKRCRES